MEGIENRRPPIGRFCGSNFWRSVPISQLIGKLATMLNEGQLAILREISQSIAFADDKQGEVEHLIIEGYVLKDGDLYELTPKGIKVLEDHAAALADIPAGTLPPGFANVYRRKT